jgi:hypothetical protein
MRFLTLILTLLVPCLIHGQVKLEYEKRINKSEFPQAAIHWLDSHPELPKRIRYLLETDGQIHTYEAKFVHEKKWHSIEFDSLGQLQDVEVLINRKEIPQPLREKVEAYLDAQYDKWRKDRIQRQYTAAANGPRVLERLWAEDATVECNLEIEVSVKEGRKTAHYELLFDPDGAHVATRKIEGQTYDYRKF